MLEAYGLTDPGCVRKNNEDYFRILPDLGLYVLADGMGGAQAGELASRIAVESVVDWVTRTPARTVDTLLDAFRDANRRVVGTAAQSAHLTGMGTTLVGALECDGQLAVASVGDSRLYSFEEGTLKPVTDDQTWANEVGRRLGLDENRLRTHPMRHVLTMAIGVEVTLRIHSYTLAVPPGAQFLLCSDGLHGVIPAGDIRDCLGDNGSLEAKCKNLVQAARQAGGPDNITAVVLRAN